MGVLLEKQKRLNHEEHEEHEEKRSSRGKTAD
jgi:hypothetical protein